jgi:hypothetical protein
MLLPSRPGSTAAVCSASTRVTRPSISTSGRKLAARADVDVGATSHVDSGSWSDWTTTAYREPDCSWPRLRRGAWSRKTSPRTQRLHVAKHLDGLGAVCLVRSELLSLSAKRRGSLSARGLDESRPNRGRYWCPVSGQDRKRPGCILIWSKGDRVSHRANVLQIVRQRTGRTSRINLPARLSSLLGTGVALERIVVRQMWVVRRCGDRYPSWSTEPSAIAALGPQRASPHQQPRCRCAATTSEKQPHIDTTSVSCY